uniref:Uncharacterized protein n=1 Tax=Rhizobium phage LG08 TaxID=3129229 RepID=A0AAU8HXL8_9CAUD
MISMPTTTRTLATTVNMTSTQTSSHSETRELLLPL